MVERLNLSVRWLFLFKRNLFFEWLFNKRVFLIVLIFFLEFQFDIWSFSLICFRKFELMQIHSSRTFFFQFFLLINSVQTLLVNHHHSLLVSILDLNFLSLWFFLFPLNEIRLNETLKQFHFSQPLFPLPHPIKKQFIKPCFERLNYKLQMCSLQFPLLSQEFDSENPKIKLNLKQRWLLLLLSSLNFISWCQFSNELRCLVFIAN